MTGRVRSASARAERVRAELAGGRGRARRRPRDAWGSVLPALLLVPMVGGVLWYVGSLPHSLPEVVLVVLLGGVALTLALASAARLGDGVERAYWVSTPRGDSVPPAALDYRLLRLRRDLRDAVERDDRPDHVHAVVRGLAAERLQARHGVDLQTEPDRAAALVGPALWHYLTHPPTDTRRRSRSALENALEGIENL